MRATATEPVRIETGGQSRRQQESKSKNEAKGNKVDSARKTTAIAADIREQHLDSERTEETKEEERQS